MKNVENRVCVIGLGNVGLPTALHIHNHGFPTCGYDIDEQKLKEISQFPVFSDWPLVPKAQIYVICATAGLEDGKPDMSNLFGICGKIAGLQLKGKQPLVVIESTVLVGTCRKLAELFSRVYMVHVPHRYWSLDPQHHGVKQTRVIGALNGSSLVKAKEFYERLEIPLHVVDSLEVAEMIKIAENAYRFVQIAFSEELKMICGKVGVPFEAVRKGANTKWNINLLEALDGIGGECLPKDIKFLRSLWDGTTLLDGAIEADKRYKDYIIQERDGRK